ncbi:MAG: SUF system Fe-S cluster assembly protein [Acidobacteriota bacterium]
MTMEPSKNPVSFDGGAPDEEPVGNAEDRNTGGASAPRGGPTLEERIVQALKTVYDPEIPVDIYELGLIYDVDVDEGTGEVHLKMTLTSPACPVAGSLPGEVQQSVEGVAGVERAEVELVWDPPWNPDMMSEAAQLQLGFM